MELIIGGVLMLGLVVFVAWKWPTWFGKSVEQATTKIDEVVKKD